MINFKKYHFKYIVAIAVCILILLFCGFVLADAISLTIRNLVIGILLLDILILVWAVVEFLSVLDDKNEEDSK